MKYILELVDNNNFIEHLCRKNSEREFYPTTTTVNAFKAQVFDTEETPIDDLEWFQEEAREKYRTLIKVVQIL